MLVVADGGICIEGAAAGEEGGSGGRAVLTMPSLSGDPLQRTERNAAVLAPERHHRPIHLWNGFLNESAAAMVLIMKLSANLNYSPCSPSETHTRVSVPLLSVIRQVLYLSVNQVLLSLLALCWLWSWAGSSSHPSHGHSPVLGVHHRIPEH